MSARKAVRRNAWITTKAFAEIAFAFALAMVVASLFYWPTQWELVLTFARIAAALAMVALAVSGAALVVAAMATVWPLFVAGVAGVWEGIAAVFTALSFRQRPGPVRPTPAPEPPILPEWFETEGMPVAAWTARAALEPLANRTLRGAPMCCPECGETAPVPATTDAPAPVDLAYPLTHRPFLDDGIAQCPKTGRRWVPVWVNTIALPITVVTGHIDDGGIMRQWPDPH